MSRLHRYITESDRYYVEFSHNKSGYIEIMYSFRLPNSPKYAGLHLSLSDYSNKNDKIEKNKYYNFGYSLVASTKQGNRTIQNGNEAKKYYPLKEDREYIKDVLYEVTEKFIKDNPVNIIVRGPLNDFKVGLDRYKHITEIIKQSGYKYYDIINVGSDKFIIQSKHDIVVDDDMVNSIKLRWNI